MYLEIIKHLYMLKTKVIKLEYLSNEKSFNTLKKLFTKTLTTT